jgi:hypothetical protein
MKSAVDWGVDQAARRRSRRFVVVTLMAVYCLAIFFALDFLYSQMSRSAPAIARIAHPVFHHTLRPNFDGYEAWGDRQYRLITNSLGFKDSATRDIALKSNTRRIVLIGDSFTEGIGTRFEESFAGMLAVAGRQRSIKTEFLDAAVVGYSPTIYYRKIKFLLDDGLDFNEVIVFPDLSDVRDEATGYFCFDDDPQYKPLCPGQSSLPQQTPSGNLQQRLDDTMHSLGGYLQRSFAVSDALRYIVKFKLLEWSGKSRRDQLTPSSPPAPIGWSVPDYDVGDAYNPLGVEGGIRRALEHMQALADLLAERHVDLTVVVYPWPLSLVQDDPGGRWVRMWRQFCVTNCKSFIDTFPDFIAARDAHADWYERYFIPGDFHFSRAGHKIVFDALTKAGL